MLVVVGRIPAEKLIFAIFICCISIKMYSFHMPLDEIGDDIVQEVSQWQLLVVLFSGLIITGFPGLTGPGSPLDSLLVFLMFVGPLFSVVLLYVENQGTEDEAAEDEPEPLAHTAAVTCVAINKTCIVSGSADSTVKIYDRQTGQLRHTIHHDGEVNSVSIKGNMVISQSKDASLRWSDVDSGSTIRIFKRADGKRTTSLNYCQDVARGLQIWATIDHKLKVWSQNRGQRVAVCEGHTGRINAVAVHGNFIVSGSDDTSVRVWVKVKSFIHANSPCSIYSD